MCEIFQISLNFKEISVKNISDDSESQEVSIYLDYLGNKWEGDDCIILIDGCHPIRNAFVIKSACPIDNEDYSFNVFGGDVKIQLYSSKLVEKSKRKSGKINVLFAEGSINLLQDLKEIKKYPTRNVKLEVTDQENTEIVLEYEINFENPPNIDSILSVTIVNIQNFTLLDSESCEACFRFPFNQNFRAVLMHKITKILKTDEKSYLMDDLLKENNFEINENFSVINLCYENFQTSNGLSLLNDLIKNNQKILIELKFNDKMYMTFVDLTIFNHPDVTNVNFIVPLYKWSNKLIISQFNQDACFTRNVTSNERRSKKSEMSENSIDIEEALKPIIIDGKYAALEINLKISNPLVCEKSLDFMMQELNQKFQFMFEIKEQKYAIQESQNCLRCIVQQIASIFDKIIADNLELNDDDIMQKCKVFVNSTEFCHKNEFKEVIEKIIGNTFNQESKTETNHDFKIMLMNAFKSLSFMVDDILIIRHNKMRDLKKVLLNKHVRKWQIEEFIGSQNYEKAELLIKHEFDQNLNELELKEKAVYMLKLKKYDDVETILKQLLKIYNYCSFSLYILSYIFYLRNDLEAAILILTILTKIKPYSLEYWIILESLYEKVGNVPGVKFCAIRMQGCQYTSNFKLKNSIIHPELVYIDQLTNILWNQYKFLMTEFCQITQKFIQKNQPSGIAQYENSILEIIQLIDNGKCQEALSILQEISMDDENEITLRILKGNILYNCDRWKAICEYEIAYNLCQQFKIKFPMIPVLRCGLWYLNVMENLTKAKKYYQFCCTNFGTFQSLSGLGKAYLKSNEFIPAEKCFSEANLIDSNWLFLSLINTKLNRHNAALNYYLASKNLGVENCMELIEIEEYLDI